MTKKVSSLEIVQRLQEKFPNKPAAELKEIYDEVNNIFKEVVENRDTLYIKCLGTFKPATTKPRIGRNLYTGESVDIPEKKKVKFSLTRSIKEKLNEKPKKTTPPKKTKKNPYKKK